MIRPTVLDMVGLLAYNTGYGWDYWLQVYRHKSRGDVRVYPVPPPANVCVHRHRAQAQRQLLCRCTRTRNRHGSVVSGSFRGDELAATQVGDVTRQH